MAFQAALAGTASFGVGRSSASVANRSGPGTGHDVLVLPGHPGAKSLASRCKRIFFGEILKILEDDSFQRICMFLWIGINGFKDVLATSS